MMSDQTAVKLLYDFGYSRSDLAEMFGMSRSQIFRRVAGQERLGGTLSSARRYQAEVAAYVKRHPGCSVFDISLECHMSENMARRFANGVRRSGAA